MAIAKEIWDKAKVLFETGMSLSNIERETDINSSSISKRAKKEGWEKGKIQDLKAQIIGAEIENSRAIEKKSRVVEKIKEANLDDFAITVLSENIKKELKHESLIFDTATLALIRNNEILTKGTKTVMLKVAQYGEGGKTSEDYEPYEVPLASSDIKDIVESTDKASLTLNVNPRHAPKIEINQNQAQQQSLTKAEISQAVAESLPD